MSFNPIAPILRGAGFDGTCGPLVRVFDGISDGEVGKDVLALNQAVSDGYVLTNRYGLDAFAIRNIVSLLKDLHEAGHIQRGGDVVLFRSGKGQ